MERQLATIRQIRELVPIEGADLIEVAKIDGWQCVVKKGEFSTHDLCVYFEIDSFLPIRPEYEFLRKSSLKRMNGFEGFRLKTIRLRGQLSQGLALPIDACPGLREFIMLHIVTGDGLQGLDVTEFLGVTKWEPPIPAQMAGKMKGNFPSFIPKTDQERVQNIPEVVEEHADTEFFVTTKLDGASCTFYLYNDVFGVCSRNIDLFETPENVYWQAARKYDVEATIRVFAQNRGLKGVAFQGELVGPTIQKNAENHKELHFYLFDVFNIDTQEYFDPVDALMIYKEVDFQIVPIVAAGSLRALGLNSVEKILAFAEGKSIFSDNREGVVFSRTCGAGDPCTRFTFKAISNKYLLGEKE